MTTLYILRYYAEKDFSIKKAPFSKPHKELMENELKENRMIIAGGLDNPKDGGMLIFTEELFAKKFTEKDPYVTQGIITKWEIRKWNIVIGKF